MSDTAPGAASSAGSASSTGSTPSAATASKSRLRRALSHPLAHLIAAFVVLALVQGFVVKLFMVPSGSMEHTLEVGDRILANRLAYGPFTSATPQTGDVVVVHTDDELWPSSSAEETGLVASAKHAVKWVFGDLLGLGPMSDHTLVKRVIGAEGQTVACCDAEGRVTIDGVPLDEPYVFEDPPFLVDSLDCETAVVSARCFPAVTVPEGMLLVLGDHRGASSDGITRCRGANDSPADTCVRWVKVDDVVGAVWRIVWPLGRFGSLEHES